VTTLRPVSGLVVACLLLAACAAPGGVGGGPGGAGASSDDTTSGVASTGRRDPTPDVAPRDDLVSTRALQWVRAESVGDDRVRVFFTASNPECAGQSVQVEETDEAVTIALREGTLPEAPGVCAAVAVQASMVVRTRAPLGERAIRQPGS